VKSRIQHAIHVALLSAFCLQLLLASATFALAEAKGYAGREKKFKGVIVTREGSVLEVKDSKAKVIRTITVTDKTKIKRERKTLDGSALLPGLTVKVKGIETPDGKVEAKSITFNPDAFAVTVALEKQFLENREATSHAQSTADTATASATTAQESANQAQSTANLGLSTAQSAGSMAASDAVGIRNLNQRVTAVGEYKTVAEMGVYFKENSHELTASAKNALDQLMAANSSLTGYVIEIAGYTSSTGGTQYNQKLSEQRAAAVAQYLRASANVPLSRIAVPAGYGESHPAATNENANGRALNRRVDVTILVSKGVQEDATSQSMLTGNVAPAQ
jgi:outer membrane protein OmpA-like peptidoglycan-associated protein